jgi:hypothetical protein
LEFARISTISSYYDLRDGSRVLRVLPVANVAFSMAQMGKMFGLAFSDAMFHQILKQNLVAVGANIVSDYFGLLVIRLLFVRGANRPVLMLFLGPVGGTLLIFVIFIVRDYCLSGFQFQIGHPFQ